MQLLEEINKEIAVKKLPDIRPGDTVRVHLRIREGAKERVQVFEGLVIRRRGGGTPQASITVRRIASGVGTERVFLLHSPRIVRIQITKRSKVRRAYLTYIRGRRGKSARLQERRFDRIDMNMEALLSQEDAQAETAEAPVAPTAAPEVPGNDPVTPEDEVPVADSPEEVSEAAPMETPATTEAEEAATGEVSDAQITEISPGDSAVTEPLREDTVSTEELVEEENREAHVTGDDLAPDENQVPAEATEQGRDAADSDESSPAQLIEEADAETEAASRAAEAEETKKD